MNNYFEDAGIDPVPFMPVFAPPPFCLDRGVGTEVWDTTGKRYLDFLSGLAVVSLGHCNRVVSEAIENAAHRLMHVTSIFTNPSALAAATKLTGLLAEATGQVGQVFFANSGAEANECAIKLARKFGGRGRHTVVTAFGSFHGRTLATLAATGQPGKHEIFAPMPDGFKHVAWGDVDALAAAVDGTVAAVMLEPIQGEGGVIPAPDGYLEAARRICDDAGTLLILDEIQTGFARTGQWFGFQHADIRPDVVTMAKAMGNGMPVGACWARRDVSAVFQPGDHGSTYSGTAIATAAVCAVIDEMQRIDAPDLAGERGAYFVELLQQIEQVESVRGQGLILGAQLIDGIDAKAVYADLLDRGLICNAVNASTLRFLPPLTVSETELDEAAAMVAAALATAGR